MKIKERSAGRLAALLASICILALPVQITAQDATDTVTADRSTGDTLKCSENISLCRAAHLNGDPASATGYLRDVMTRCPAMTEDIYTEGESLYRELFDRTGEQEYVDTILMILTQRTYYFGNKPSNDMHKAELLLDLAGDDPEYLGLCYNILMEGAESYPDQMSCADFVHMATVAASLYVMGIIDTEEMANAFITSIGTVDDRIENGRGDCNNSEDLENMETFYRTSGAMTCEGITTLYATKVDRDFRDTVFIGKVYDMLTEGGCAGSDLYYNVAVKMYANKRSVENALRLAELNVTRNDSDRAISYFTDAYNRDTSSISRSGVLNRIALSDLGQGRRQEARNRAEHAWQLNNRNARALMILAECYAGAELGNDFDNHAAYWIAVDYLEAAVKVDPALRQEAEPKMKAWSGLFPTREECFYRRILDEGTVITVGSWVNEVTHVRFRRDQSGRIL
ncbi:MAG: tetratricopeptide repeat protein [Bacteroidales bacterium]|nr:tetratricopeptide repeat protein [Bacteroidales bacterium]